MKILKPWVSDEHSIEFRKYNGFHTGVDIDITDVTALASGVVTQFCNDEEGIVVTVQFDANNSLRYCHLKSACVQLGNILSKGDAIGAANRFLHLELIKPIQSQPIWPVRIGSLTHYKHDPTSIVDGTFILDSSDVWYNNLNLQITRPDDFPQFDVKPDPNEEP